MTRERLYDNLMSGMQTQARDGYEVSTDPARVDRGLVHRFLSEESAWARGIPREVVDRAIDNSLCFGVYWDAKQVAFARVVTDYATFAYLDDVFVVEDHRRKGLAPQLIETVLGHPALEGIKSWWLLAGSEGARKLFERAGFSTPEPERLGRWMTLPGNSRGFYLRQRGKA